MSGSEQKVNENTYGISSIKKVLEVSRCSCATQRQKNVQKVCCTCKVVFFFFCQLDLLLFFTVLRRCLRCLALHDFLFCLNKLQILSRASFLALVKSIYYIDTSVLLENIPLVKFIKTTPGPKWFIFHNLTREFINDIISVISL